MSKLSKILSLIGTIVAFLLTALSAVFLLTDADIFENNRIYIVVCFILVIIIELLVVVVNRYMAYQKDLSDEYDQAATYLNRLIKYNKQRDEIEEEIRVLTKQLEMTSVAQYIDVHRLAFSGQNSNSLSSSIDYENFLRQFGLEKEQLAVRTGTAAFLTPFDIQGNKLFNTCQSILGKIDIFLRKTDNLVEKDDILMNIVTMIVQSEFILANIDGRNPNVYYELGIAHALGKPTILLSRSTHNLNEIGFDIRQKRIIIYENKQDLESQLLSQISMLKRAQQ